MTKSILIRVITLLIVMVLVLAGCQGVDTNQPKATEKPATTQPAATQPADATKAPNGETELEPVVLEWYNYCLNPITDLDMVFEELNKYFEEKINATVNPHFFDNVDYKDKMATVITSGQPLDIAFCNPTRLDYVENAQKGAFMPIEDIVYEYAPETSANVPDFLWDAITIDGHIYGVPVVKDLARHWEMEFNKTMADAIGIDVSQEWGSVNDLVPMFREAKAAKDATFPEDKDIPLARNVFSDMRAYYPHDTVISFVIANIPGAEMFEGMGSGETAFSIYHTDEYRYHANLMKELVDMVYFHMMQLISIRIMC